MLLFFALALGNTNFNKDDRTVYLDIEYTPKSQTTPKIGRLIIDLHDSVVEITTQNFYDLVTNQSGPKKYLNSKFHRIIPNFMIQGGDFTRGNGTGGDSYKGGKFDDENFDLKHDRVGVLSMANAGPNTNGSQFFITVAETKWLDGNYVVFGHVRKECLEILNEISKVRTKGQDVPFYDVVIKGCGDFKKLPVKDQTNEPNNYYGDNEIKEVL